MNLADEKRTLRDAMKERLSSMLEKDKRVESAGICKTLEQKLPEHVGICVYWPLSTEPDIRPLITTLLERGNRVFLPCFSQNCLYRELRSIENIHRGELGTMEPPADAPLLKEDDATIVLLPGRAFAPDGKRLGRGNGGFDIWIAEKRAEQSAMEFWGVCYECQMLNTIPMEPHDQYVNSIVTARGKMDVAKSSANT